MLTFVLVSLLSGALTVLAPCVVSILPLVVAKSAQNNDEPERSRSLVIFGLLGSIFIFSILLKATTLLIDVPPRFWQIFSGVIIIFFGLSMLLPDLWETISTKLKLQQKAQTSSAKALGRKGPLGDLLLGASLGPVFSACSPTYSIIVASILPADPLKGLLYLTAFLIGLGVMLAAIITFGSKLVTRLGWGINPHGWFKRIIGVLFIIIGLMFITGLDKKIQTNLIERGLFDWQVNLESTLQ